MAPPEGKRFGVGAAGLFCCRDYRLAAQSATSSKLSNGLASLAVLFFALQFFARVPRKEKTAQVEKDRSDLDLSRSILDFPHSLFHRRFPDSLLCLLSISRDYGDLALQF